MKFHDKDDKMKTRLCAAVAALVPLTAFAQDGMAVADAYARASNPKSGAAFMLLENHRDTACTLTAVSSEAAEKVELHSHQEVDGMMKMGPIEGGIEIAPGASHALERGGDHVMMMGLATPLIKGETVALSLDFGNCGTLDIEVPVDNDRTPEPASGMDHGAHSGHGN
jgi:copper(I)-binding protein